MCNPKDYLRYEYQLVITRQEQDVNIMSPQRRCNVMTLHQR